MYPGPRRARSRVQNLGLYGYLLYPRLGLVLAPYRPWAEDGGGLDFGRKINTDDASTGARVPVSSLPVADHATFDAAGSNGVARDLAESVTAGPARSA